MSQTTMLARSRISYFSHIQSSDYLDLFLHILMKSYEF